MENLTALINAAIDSTTAPRFAVTTVNGHQVEARVVEQCRRTTGRAIQRPSIMWTVDGKRVAVAKLQQMLAQ